MPQDDSWRAPFDPERRSTPDDFGGLDEDPNKPEIPQITGREAREQRQEERRQKRHDYYSERYGDRSAEARRTAGPAEQVSAEQANAAMGIGGGGGNQELVAAIRELIAAVRGMGGN